MTEDTPIYNDNNMLRILRGSSISGSDVSMRTAPRLDTLHTMCLKRTWDYICHAQGLRRQAIHLTHADDRHVAVPSLHALCIRPWKSEDVAKAGSNRSDRLLHSAYI